MVPMQFASKKQSSLSNSGRVDHHTQVRLTEATIWAVVALTITWQACPWDS
jgi:hypothetical protein